METTRYPARNVDMNITESYEIKELQAKGGNRVVQSMSIGLPSLQYLWILQVVMGQVNGNITGIRQWLPQQLVERGNKWNKSEKRNIRHSGRYKIWLKI